ncbi:MAG TPA: 30S ribosome-binding factor RbfA [Gemmatimonadaceae bacterium]|nr:30S ribosome-binding factor RbfA [Gemmatimonadaceae bacterium]
MAEPRRADRVAESIRTEIATFLAEEVKDPRIRAFVTVTGVDVTRDLRQARVFVSLMGDEADRQSTIEGLTHLAPHLRSRIGKSLRLRAAPEIEFRVDDSIARAARIDSLLAQARGDETTAPSEDKE